MQRWLSGTLTIIALLQVAIGGRVAVAASDHSSDTYAGDYAAGSLPTGTFVALQYMGYFHANAFIDSSGQQLPNSHAGIYEEFTRFAYITQIGGHPLVFDAEVPAATVNDVNIPGTNNQVASGFADPVVHFTYFPVADPRFQRWIGLTDYFYLPLGRSFDNQKAINVSTPRQFTNVPQLGYTEGLGKFTPNLNNVFFDFVANASFHTNGDSPLLVINPATAPVAGILRYDTLTQRPSYDVKAFLRYAPPTPVFLFVAVGVEKSWGGEQFAANGSFAITGLPIVLPQSNLSLGKDDFLRGHVQFQIPFTQDFVVAADIFHDFARVGGFREDIGAEIRLSKLFYPKSPSR
jgi:hypothetical protein